MTKNDRNLRETANKIMEWVPQVKLRAFTLAEVLITLVIIGVVSVLVLPTVINKVQGYANKRAHQVFYKKFETGLQMMQGANALAGYNSTESFVENLQKYIKIAKICDNQHLFECFSSEITDGNGNKLTINNGLKLGNFMDVPSGAIDTNINGVILQDGTSILLAYNTNCTNSENGSIMPNMGCISLIFDINGGGMPNRVGRTTTELGMRLDTKEDNSSVGLVKDIGNINAPYYGKIRFYGNASSCQAIGGYVYSNSTKCAIWKNNVSWNIMTSNACPTNTCALNESQRKAWCETTFGTGFKIPDTRYVTQSVVNVIKSSGYTFIKGENLYTNFWSPDSYSGNIAYYVQLRYGAATIENFKGTKETQDGPMYAICISDIVP